MSLESLFVSIIELLSKEGSLKAILVALTLAAIVYLFKHFINRSASLFNDHDKIRQDLNNDRAELRQQIKEMIEQSEKLQDRNDKLQQKTEEQAELIHDMAIKEIKLRAIVVECCGEFPQELKDIDKE